MEVMQEDYGGYAGRLRRLWTEEKARDRSVPDGSDKNELFYAKCYYNLSVVSFVRSSFSHSTS